MMLFAGADCSVQPLGRIFNSDYKIIGFIMPLERALAPSGGYMNIEFIPRPKLSREQKKAVIFKLCQLMKILHAKGIVHGDVKPQNLLLCSDGEVRLCDWANASTEGEAKIPQAVSEHYLSPRRCALFFEPITMADDLYATGVSIWEIWMEVEPFKGINNEDVEEVVMAGLRPDIGAIDDPSIAALITSYLDAGPPPSNKPGQSNNICTRTDIIFQKCLTYPPHTETRIVRCFKCQNPTCEPCKDLFRMPNIEATASSPVCPECNL